MKKKNAIEILIRAAQLSVLGILFQNVICNSRWLEIDCLTIQIISNTQKSKSKKQTKTI